MLNETTRKQIESVYGHKIRYPKDCDALAIDITSKTKCQISSSTLKRLLGFNKTNGRPNQYTLDTIAIYLGYPSWNESHLDDTQNAHFLHESKFIEIPSKKRQDQKMAFNWGIIGILALIIFALIFNFSKSLVLTSESLIYSPMPSLPEARSSGRSIALNHSIFYLGGYNGAFVCNNNWEFNSTSNSYTNRAPMLTKRAEMGAALVDYKIYCFGGWLGSSLGMTDAAEVYDIKRDQWDTLPKLPIKMTGVSAVAKGQDIYILGGTTGETNTFFLRFNTISQQYEPLPLFNLGLVHSCFLMVKNKIYVIGGQSYKHSKYQWHTNVFVYDIGDKEWGTKKSLPLSISTSAAVAVNNQIHLFGGKNNYANDNSSLKDIHLIYNTLNDTWKVSEKLPYAICAHQVVYLKNKFVLLGGNRNYPNPTHDVISF